MKRDLATITDTIRQSVTAYQIGEALGLKPDYRGRCACPIHAGHDKNMKLWKDESRFYCHVCHASGDGIALVRAVLILAYRLTVRWIKTPQKPPESPRNGAGWNGNSSAGLSVKNSINTWTL